MVKAVVLLVYVLHVAGQDDEKREAGDDIENGYNSVGVVKDIPSEKDDKTLLDEIGGVESPGCFKEGLKSRSLKTLNDPSNTVVSLYKQCESDRKHQLDVIVLYPAHFFLGVRCNELILKVPWLCTTEEHYLKCYHRDAEE